MAYLKKKSFHLTYFNHIKLFIKPVILGYLFKHKFNATAIEIKLIEQFADH